ncbi:DUF4132 domain-containing protein [Cellulomonas sp. S1-8]|uniref:DUF4132 domain-containing protein n=1 Tax=Cellulomonas sp. S1-8 TaxID=2904790 RepID=UPI00224435B5|nr:DUF4132 domain-containing protein [Cellulomonas sp. S1-8]UZN04247.1 DUF4132 domain-containing protein [Cellulomonas sp. S1-8]
MGIFGRGRRRPDADGTAPGTWVRDLRSVVSALPDARGVADYVLTGGDPGPVTALTRPPGVPHEAWVPNPYRTDGPVDLAALRSLYAGFAGVDAAVLRRWAHVLDALRAPMPGWRSTVAPLAGEQWHDLVLMHVVAVTPGTEPLPVTFAALARVAAVDATTPRDLVTALLSPTEPARYFHRYDAVHVGRLPGLGDVLVEHHDLVAAALTTREVDTRVVLLEIVDSALTDDRLASVVDVLADLATISNARLRERAEPMLARAPGAAGALRTVAVEGSPGSRARALELLAQQPDQREWARGTALADRAASVQDLVVRWDAAATLADLTQDDVHPGPLAAIVWAVPPESAQACARRLVDDLTEVIAHQNHVRRSNPRYGGTPLQTLPTERTYHDLVALLVADSPPSPDPVVAAWHGTATDALQGMARDGLLDAASAVKLAAALDLITPGYGRGTCDTTFHLVHALTGGPDLRTLQAMLDQSGADGRALIWRSYCSRYGVRLGRTWDPAEVWPFVADNLDWIMADTSGDEWAVDDLAPFAAFATLPHLPARLVEHLLGLAVGTPKARRAPAQAALVGTPGIAARAAARLTDTRADVRIATAHWLARLADPTVLPALQAAWAKERQDVVRGALLDALVAVGERAETYLDPQATSRTAAKALAKGLPAALAWCAWEAVPQVRWASSGAVVPREVVQWLCATAVRSRSAEPDAVLRQYAALFDRDDRERLAHHLLTSWVHADTRTLTPAEAEDQARASATVHHGWMTASGSPYAGMTVEQLAAATLPDHLGQPAGSQAASKGVLAVVAACGGREVVAPAERYLRTWYGRRPAQGKALIAMLAWVDDPSATQLVLAMGSRFRTRSFQDEAITQAAALAERKGWTVDELADRTIPTGGFDDDGVLELPYGPRTFVARLLPDLTVDLRDPDGKPITTLPPPRRTDDEDQAKESRKALTAAKKDVKTIADLQQRRLYEALCTERSWSVGDWQRYLAAHPVVGPAIRRVVWVATDAGAADGTGPVVFRPLDDGTLTDVDDEPVTLAPTARVRVAHDSILTGDQVTAWTAHLADYQITPLFAQLGRGVHTVDEQDLTRDVLRDFEGHVLGAFALRRHALRLGYARGPAEDGAWFASYTKRFPTLGIVAHLDFSGNDLPEQDRAVALRALGFSRQRPGADLEPLTLGDVPTVLLSECWHDLRDLAAQGTGFDPDWATKTEF